MQEHGGTSEYSPEKSLISRLLFEHFDGIILISADTGMLIKTNAFLAGKLFGLVDFSGKLSYDEQTEKIINDWISDIDRNMLKKSITLSQIKEILEKQERYHIDYRIKGSNVKPYTYKRLSYFYLNRNRDIIVMTLRDISDILSNEIDPLTGLYNSTGFHNHVREWIENNPGKKYRIQRYDIDRFKDINGIYGYSMGNRLLRDFGQYMKEQDNEYSFSAHLNADHFVRFCAEDSPSIEEYQEIFFDSFKKYDLKMPISIHIGVYDLCEDDCNSFTMNYKALLALQTTKGKFDKPIAYYEKGMMDTEVEQQGLLNDVDRAVEKEEFQVWFQPQVNYKTKTLSGVEALIRWHHPEKGILAPASFIDLLESSDQINTVDKYTIGRVCRYMQKWKAEMPDKDFTVSVNLSRKDIQSPDFAKRLTAYVKKHNIAPKNIHLEITESAYMDNSEMLISVVNDLKADGFIIEMDDFGSGYSSLNTLKDIDIDILKLDMRFLAGMHNTERSRVIISSIIQMANALNIPVIAEGVETKEQADMLLNFGCEMMQGYYFSKPIPANEYENMLKNYQNKQ